MIRRLVLRLLLRDWSSLLLLLCLWRNGLCQHIYLVGLIRSCDDLYVWVSLCVLRVSGRFYDISHLVGRE